LDRVVSKRTIETKEIVEIAIKNYKELKGMCGLDKPLADVREKYPKCSRNKLYAIQKKYQLYSKRKRKYKATTNSNHKLPVADNLLN
jgi:putative transposase